MRVMALGPKNPHGLEGSPLYDALNVAKLNATFNLKELYGPNAAAFGEHLGELRQAAAADPADPTAGFLLGYHLWFLGETAEAVRLFKRAARQANDNGVIERFLVEAEGKKA